MIMTQTMILSKEEYNLLKYKANIFDHYIETEELTKKELSKIQNALKSNMISKDDFLKKHPELKDV